MAVVAFPLHGKMFPDQSLTFQVAMSRAKLVRFLADLSGKF